MMHKINGLWKFHITAHTHLKLPQKIDYLLGFLFITPNLHHVHHHFELPYTDCNYGDVLSIWNRLFGTHKVKKRATIQYGLDVFDPVQASSFLNLIKAIWLIKV